MTERKLSDLNPEFEPTALWFDCPVCVRTHSIAVSWVAPCPYNEGRIWQLVDARPEHLTLVPSIDCSRGASGCTFHGWVQDGKVVWT